MPERFLAADRRRWIADGADQTVAQTGAALFLDISGFTPLADALAEASGHRSAEELGSLLNGLFAPLIDAVARRGGAVVGFAGDALSCWFADDDGRRAGLAALHCQQIILGAEVIQSSAGERRLEAKVSVATGSAVRTGVGDPGIQLMEAFFGEAVDRAAAGEKLARPGEVVVDEVTAAALHDLVTPSEWRDSAGTPRAVLDPRRTVLTPDDGSDPAIGTYRVPPEALERWVHPRIREILRLGSETDLSENRPAVTLFLSFGGIDLAAPHAPEVLDGYLTHVQRVLAECGGTLLAVTFGDKGSYCLAAFGVPQAHSDDPVRALAAAEALREPPPGSPVTDVRIGVAAGRIWSGVIGGPGRATYTVMGDSVNVAARLMELARPGQILVTGDFATADGRFELWPVPRQLIKGHSGIAAAELVTPESDAGSRLHPRTHRLPMVGRQEELARVHARLDAALAGEGGTIHITGAAGLGKSRLTDEIVAAAVARGFRTAGSEAHSYGTATPYLVWRRTLRMLLDFRPGDSPERQVARLERALAAVAPELPAMAPLFGPLLGIEIEENETSGLIPAQARKDAVRGLLVPLLASLAAHQPMLVVIEDAQWLDSLSRELLAALVAPAATMPMVLVAVERTEEQAPVPLGEPLDHLELGPLPEADMSDLFDLKLDQFFNVSGPRPEALAARVLGHADGNPLFCDALLRDLHERGFDPLDDDAVGRVELPGSLQRLALDRLDRLPAFERAVLRFCSAVGRRVPEPWLEGSAPHLVEADDFAHAMTALVEAGIMSLSRPPETPAYVFTSATFHEAVYESLAGETRHSYHGAIAEHLEATPAPPIELLVYHYRSAERPGDELRHLPAAGEAALRLGAFGDARDLFRRGLEILAELPAELDAATVELGLQLGLGASLIPLEGHRSPAAAECYERANLLTARAAPGPETGRAMFGLWTHYLFSGDLGRSIELAEALLFGAQMSGDEEAIMQSHLAVSLTTYWRGDLAGTIEHARECVARYDPAEAAGYVARFAQNPRITAMTDAVWATWMRGDAVEALAMADATVEHARSLGHPWMQTIALQTHPILYAHMGDVEGAAVAGAEFMAAAEQMGNPVYIGLAVVALGWVAGASGDVEQGLGMLLGVREGMRGEGVRILDPLITTLALDVCARNRRPGEGLALMDEYLAETDVSEHRLYLGEQLRLRAELLRIADSSADVTAILDQAEALAREFGAASYLLRVLLTRERLGVGVRPDLHAEIDATIGRLHRCTGTPDLEVARSVIERMGA